MQANPPTIQLVAAARRLALCLAMMCGNAAAQPAADLGALEAKAQRGDVTALMTLAGIYERGEDVTQDFARSNALYCKAAARGNVDAILKLGLIYSSGREMIPNEGVGALLIHKAAELGSERAREILPLISRGVGSVLPACMTEPVAPLLRVRGLTKNFRSAAASSRATSRWCTRSTMSHSTSRRAKRSGWSASPARASRPPAAASCA